MSAAEHRHASSGYGADPVAVLVRRGDRIESTHRVAYAVVDAAGAVLHHEGDIRRPVFARSSVKPLQALPLIESGAAERFAVSEQELALACASHGGEPMHTEIVAAAGAPWPRSVRPGMRRPCALARGDRPAAGRAAPAAVATAQQLLGQACRHAHPGAASGGAGRRLHRPRSSGAAADQRAAGGDFRASLAPPAVDGCGVPTHAMPLAGLAMAMARLADPGQDPGAPGRAEACARVRAAMAAHPLLVAGSGAPAA